MNHLNQLLEVQEDGKALGIIEHSFYEHSNGAHKQIKVVALDNNCESGTSFAHLCQTNLVCVFLYCL